MEASEEMRGKEIQCPTCKMMVAVSGVSTEEIHPQIVEENRSVKPSAKILRFIVSIVVLVVIGAVVFFVKTYGDSEDAVDTLAIANVKNITQNVDSNSGEKADKKDGVYSTAGADNVVRAVKEYEDSALAAREELGRWHDPSDSDKSSIVICRIKSSYFLQRYLEDKLVTQIRLAEKESVLPGRNFQDTSAGGEYQLVYRITDDGKLEIWQDSNCIATAAKIE